ncbi:hypothetical protein UPYG_G00283100 [Umbra pygmaea]|uniref:Ras-related protein Rab-36 n=1 Tax=Umbra pygmaea TaxID=75934 RepID=A0ABD0W7S8_UMBPY
MQEMRNGRMHFQPVSRDRVLSKFPKVTYSACLPASSEGKAGKCYTPQACLQMKNDWDSQTKAACKDRTTMHQGWDRLKMSKAVIVGDVNVGKTCLINRFCKDVFDRDYKATIGVDFEIERFEISGVPFSLQIWDTAGQEKFKCIASAYYRGAHMIIIVFDMADIKTLEHTRQWSEEAMSENEPGSCSIFLVGTKRDLLAPQERQRTERDAIKMANEMNAEFWSVSAKSGENVQELFFRMAALTFEDSVLKDMELGVTSTTIGGRDDIKSDIANLQEPASKPVKTNCC